MKIKYFLLLLIILSSCKDDISNGKFRNENYVFYQENGKAGEWLKINPDKKNNLPKSNSTYFFSNGNRYAELEVLDSFPNRIIKWYNKEDVLSKTEWYLNDTLTKKKYKDGYIKLYHSNLGILSREGQVLNNIEQGEWKRYNEDGTLLKIYNLKNGLDHGKRINYYDNGSTESISNWLNDFEIGLTKYYYKSGKLKKTLSVKNKNLHGECISYYESGQIESHEFFWKGKLTDTCKYYYQNGKKRKLKVIDLDTINQTTTGIVYYYFENGGINKKIESKNSKAHGKAYIYFENGSLNQELFIINDIKTGPFSAYYETGELWFKGNAKNDVLDGNIKYFDKKGKLVKTIIAENGITLDSIMH